MFTDWPRIEPEEDEPLLQAAECTMVEFLRSLYIKEMPDPNENAGSAPVANSNPPICSN
ncbi:MAG TPA: hypothetical protein VHL54_01635 [Actinomycetota bacterium]|nr:hypothetical protein [Actinomycetota bacterium]